MNKYQKMISLFIAGSLTLAGCGGNSDYEVKQNEATNKDGVTQIKILRAWNGSSSNAPVAEKDIVNKYLKEKFNTEIVWEFVQGSEVEKLNLLFASGEMPDIIDFPYWGGNGGETGIIKRAAKDGLLAPIDEYIDKYAPKFKEIMYEGCTADFIDFDLNAPEFNGEHYIMPRETVANPIEDTQNFAYGLYIRGDIAKALNIDPANMNFKDSQDLYKVLSDIKNGGFKDVNGKAVIPASAGARGWMNGCYLNEWYDGGITEFYKDENGEFNLDILNTKNEDESVLFMRKLIYDGLFDREIFSQENVDFESKLANGSIAVVSYSNALLEMDERTLSKSHPEMKYVPMQVVPNALGDNITSSNVVMNGRSGSPAFAITKAANEQTIQKFLEILEFVNTTDEGYNLVTYGIEGETFEMVDGKPKYLPEIQAKLDDNVKNLTDMGLKANYSIFVVADKKPYGKVENSELDKRKKEAEKVFPLKFVDGVRISKYNFDYPDSQGVSITLTDYNKVKESAYFAPSDDESIAILDSYRVKATPSLKAYRDYIIQKANESGKTNIIY